jgi:transposase
MPLRVLSRAATWLLPPTLDELIGATHPARYVGCVVDALRLTDWQELGVDPAGDELGAPAYDPRALLSVWLYGFMTGVRSSRKLEAACRDQLPYLWLTGWQQPDHNTLWRFYQAHRQAMRALFKRTVRTAVQAGLVNLAVQALDGTKVQANAAGERSYDAAGLERLLERTEAAIADLEAQNQGGELPTPARLPEELAHQQALKQRVEQALAQVRAEETPRHANLTDSDAALMKSRHGVVPAYNAQAMVSPTVTDGSGVGGLLITAADVTTDAADTHQLLPLLEQAQDNTGQQAELTLADAGYHSGPNVSDCAQMGQAVAMPESQEKALAEPYHKTAFAYDAQSDTFTCPQGKTLCCVGLKHHAGQEFVIYRAPAHNCRACPAWGVCTTNRRGRELDVGPHEMAMREHRAWMHSEAVKDAYRQRKQLPEPTFGILKERHNARRFLLRGLANVQAEWSLLVTTFNLRTLYRFWQRFPDQRWTLAGALAA